MRPTGNFIISANYRDRESPERWLIGVNGGDPREAVAVSSVYATDVAFCPASDYERGFGCAIVGYCETAVAGDDASVPEVEGDTLKFTPRRYAFVNARTGRIADVVDQLLLGADGSIRAVGARRFGERPVPREEAVAM